MIDYDRMTGPLPELEPRNAKIYEARLAGRSYPSIAREFGLSATMIQMIAKRHWHRLGKPKAEPFLYGYVGHDS